MKKRIIGVLILVSVILLCACGGSKSNPEYDAAIKEISESKEGGYHIWKKYKNNDEAIVYILKKIPATDVSKLFTESNSLYGYSISHGTEMGDLIKIMSSNGFEHFPKDVVLSALRGYLPSTPGYDKDAIATLSKLEGKEFYAAVNDVFNGASSKKDAESLLLTEAFKRAESKLKKGLKNPSSYQMTSINGSQIDYNPDTGEYAAIIVIQYNATNSFGATVADTFSYAESGTYIDGRIKYKEN